MIWHQPCCSCKSATAALAAVAALPQLWSLCSSQRPPCCRHSCGCLLAARAAHKCAMQVSLDGAERTMEQWSVLLQATGFKINRIARSRCPFSVLEAKPV